MIIRTISAEAYTILDKKNKDLTDSVSSGTKPYALRGKSKVAIEKIITRKLGNDACDFISNHLREFRLFDVLLCDTRDKNNIETYQKESFRAIVNLQEVNHYRRINKFLEMVNHKLPEGGLFINTIETYESRKEKILKKFPKPLNYLYYLGDFIFHRVSPKLKWSKKIYFDITKGYGRVLTKAEVLGRLYSCGFDVIEEKVIDNKLYFVAKKTKLPLYDMNPTYGPLISLKRVGKNGKLINVYKLRTMHPYSEYLQHYVFQKNNLKKGGKLKNDFRISNTGKLLRKYWIDELPMVLNFLKGDMKLIGGRPLSSHYFSLYTKELQEKRIKFKPGLIPPFYADMPETLEEIIASEMKYLTAYERNPILTDINYLFKIIKNIVVKGKRSF
ncbi:lipopolysaccharide/colanic/teichoic acid biosynthesis glycosyltransferase [Aquimarina sp. EL_43]|uniref:sugar transferase n=1 Tax=unclassified Aquimarina TaxID=2627091 RepID=UPI0018CAD939|nr:MULTISPECIES: sugar transferase [unclassified Aquimarina]MBG6128707.1 lipopolysaccharide/colanic/teichoic acid biosynthesis glycosyltransferase [Aquimarina sp. EL_35]MBG6149770.1 lipopolysaccharide/colanic/teichoic acid biosynthesis glycosyltransferase [Aquimarina sp. EL_32]MBG6167544.1 lipopolysaccharide/colanic/teichoic acid biosynthesis glycosyltransferase [Aquimarina sp. EL_43]